MGLHDDEGKKTNVSDLITAGQMISGLFLYFMMTFDPYQDHLNFKHSHILFIFLSFVLGLWNRMACMNYEVLWDGTGPLLLQPGSNLVQGPTQPYTLGAQPTFFKTDETKENAN